MDLNLDDIINKIEQGQIIDEATVVIILMKIMEILYQECNVLVLQSPIVICGDIHGQLDDLLELFRISGDKEQQKYLFMGDYVDRGYHSLNTFLYLVCHKLMYPTQFYLLRGNHESRQISQMYGFYNECVLNYGHAGIWMMCNEAFDLLPVAAVIDRDIFSVHGGLSPDLPLIEMVSLQNRQDELPSSGPLCDLCWSDPEDVRKWRQNQRGAGYCFGENEVREFNQQNKLTMVTRSHQLIMEGFKYYFPDPEAKGEPKGRLVTIWSAPNYAYRSNNDASVMKLRFPGRDPYDLPVFKPAEHRIVPKDLPATSPYFA
ncbi:Ser/Thr protein phosphatase [Tritrichomonas foetus]|uniref:Serine/threonine-protein phosphatase n=1 Tax=Tritrichomonas foetus TaxID=1144522 RepID=A0A1J4KJR2_9EUKA|nr:Ser/Thr protein phosphatase [Tritrichomonas foetus]|eukprot:OHT11551.1 Ser/Thr protein phosphatase [Tritrichomonas foetus]